MTNELDVEQIQNIEAFFNSIINGSYTFNDVEPELMNAPTFEEICTEYQNAPLPEGDFGTNTDLIANRIKQLDDGYFKCQEIPANYDDDADSNDYEILQQINENKFPISYTSPYDGMESNKVIRVDPSTKTKGSLRKISDAIEEAMPGDLILLSAGEYKESITITKPLEIKADDNAKCTISSSELDTIILDTTVARITNIKISCTAPGNSYCIKVNNGFLEINNCDIHAQCTGAFKCENGSNLWARNCEAYCSSLYATSLMPDSRSIFESCKFHFSKANTDKSSTNETIISIGEGSIGIFINCVYDKSSIVFQQSSKGMIKGKSIIENVQTGITVLAKAEALLLNLQIQNCTSNAILLSPDSHAVIQGCDIKNCPKIGISIQASHHFAIVETTISDNPKVAVRVVNGSEGLILDTNFINNGKIENGPLGCALQMESSSRISIKNAKFEENACALLSSNDKEEGDSTSISILNSTFIKNKAAIQLHKNSILKINSSKMESNLLNFRSQENCKAEFTDCSIGHDRDHTVDIKLSIYLLKNSETIFTASQHFPSSFNAIICENSAHVTLNNSRFQSSNAVITLKDEAQAFLLENSEIHTTQTQLISQYDKNSFINAGLLLYGSSKAQIQGSYITNCPYGIFAKDNSEVNLSDGSLISKGKYGIYLTDASIAKVYSSTIQEQISQGKKTQGTSTISLAGIYMTTTQKGIPSLEITGSRLSSAGQAFIFAKGIGYDNQINHFNINNTVFDMGSNKVLPKQEACSGIYGDGIYGFINNCYFINVPEGITLFSSSCSINNCQFSENGCKKGIRIKESRAYIDTCVFQNNILDGIQIMESPEVKITRCQFLHVKNNPILSDEKSMLDEENNITN